MLDFDALLHGPVRRAFGEGGQAALLPTYTPKSGAGAYPLDGVFDRAYVEVDLGDGAPTVSVENRFGAAAGDFRALPKKGDTLTIPRLGKTFMVRNAMPDGHGWIQLVLNET